MSRKSKLVVIALLAIAVACAATWRSFPGLMLDVRLEDDIEMVEENKASIERAVNRLTRDDGTLLSGAEEAVEAVWNRHEPGELSRFFLAQAAVELIPKGFDPDAARSYAAAALEEQNYGELRSGYWNRRSEALDALLAAGPEIDINASLKACLATIDAGDWPDFLPHYARYYRTDEPEALLAALEIIDAAGLERTSFLEAVGGSPPVDEALEALQGIDSPEARGALALAYGAHYRSAEEIVRYLYGCKRLGLQPSTCYPEGVDFDLGFAKLPVFPGVKQGDEPARLLVVRHAEAAERLETRRIETQVTNPLGDPIIEPGSERFPADYDGNDKSDPNNYTTRLDTELLDRVPIEHLPSELSECNLLLVLGSENVPSEPLEFVVETLGESSLPSVPGIESDLSLFKELYQAPTYACLQTVSLNSYPGGWQLMRGDSLRNDPSKPDGEVLLQKKSGSFDLSASDKLLLATYFQGWPRQSWFLEAGAELLDGLEAKDWDAYAYIAERRAEPAAEE